MKRAAQLSCESIAVRFGTFQALRDVSLTFLPGKTTALIGPNGAGKTTLLNVLSGLQTPSAGIVRLEGRDITRSAPWQRAQQGMARSFQIVNVFPRMTVRENLRLAVQRTALKRLVPWRTVDSMRKIVQDVDERLQEFKLTDRADLPAGQLSHGEQRGLEIALSVIADPVVLLLDEPLAGVGHGEMAQYVDLLRRVAASRTTVVVEHNMDIVMDLADEIVCLTGGNVLAKGSPREIRGNEQVRAAYLGTADA